MIRNESTEVKEYLDTCESTCKDKVLLIRKLLRDYLPDGFVEGFSYGMPTYSVPHDIYPGGYHCNPSIPLPFISIACRKNEATIYHMGLYADPAWMEYFVNKYRQSTGLSPDIGKSCIRFKKKTILPESLLIETFQKMSPQNWVECYEKVFRK